MGDVNYYPSPFVSMRSSRSGVAFHDLFTGRQMVLGKGVGDRLAGVFNGEVGFEAFAAEFPDEAGKVIANSMVMTEAPPGAYLRAMVSSLDIEPAGSCNAVCGMCPRGAMTREKSVMSEETFGAICRQLAGEFGAAVRRVLFCGFGEPLQNPRLAEMSRGIRKVTPGAMITVISNGQLLTREVIEGLVKSEVDVFSCSFQSNQKRKYEALMRGLIYETTVNGLVELLAAARGTRLKVCINVTAMDENRDEIPAMMAEWGQRGAQVVVNTLHNRGGFLKLEGLARRGSSATVARCGLMNSRVFISSEGEVLSCCHDLTGDTRIGNINSEPLKEILMRRLGRIGRSELYPICGSCTDDSALVTVGVESRQSGAKFC